MQIQPDADHLTFRDARANLAALCKTGKARVILSHGVPIAILTPIDMDFLYNPAPKDHHFTAAKKRFLAALAELRTH